MRRIAIVLIFIAALVIGGILGFIITGFATAGRIQRSFNFYYEPSSPTPIENLLVNVDIGDVNIQYNTTETPYYAKIEVALDISGLFMAGKNYLDFFNPSTEWWQNTSAPTTFDMKVKPDIWFDPSHWFKSYNIDILVTLRTDVVYDIAANVATGSLKMTVPENIALNNTILQTTTGGVVLKSFANTKFQGKVSVLSTTGKTNVISKFTNFTYGLKAGTTTGSLVLNLKNCIMGNDIIGVTTTGTFTYDTDNLTFIKDSSIILQTTTGLINGTINQYVDLGANVTGILGVTTGGIDLNYINDKSSIGTQFSGSSTTGSVYYYYSDLEFTKNGNILTSNNYISAIYKYTFTLSTTTGSINVNAESHHI